MSIRKKLVALALVAVMAMSSAVAVNAETSPTTPKNPSYDTSTNQDKNKQDHSNKTVTSKVSGSSATVTKVSSKKGATGVIFNVARNKNNKKVKIATIGTGKKGVFNSKAGRYITNVKVKSSAKKVRIKKLAFKGSKVKTLQITSKKVQIDKDAFKGTKATSLTLKVSKASQLTLKKGAFNGIKKITIKGASAKEKKKIKNLLKKAGYKGTIK